MWCDELAAQRIRQQPGENPEPRGGDRAAREPPAARPSIGGQALVEGVMMRGPRSWAVAVRKPDGEIASETHALPWDPEAHPWVRWPLVRGVHVLAESLAIGMRALRISCSHTRTGRSTPCRSSSAASTPGGPTRRSAGCT